MFAYCENNPVNGKDPNGEVVLAAMAVGAVNGILSQFFVDVITNLVTGQPLDTLSSVGDYAAAAFSGAIAAIPGGGAVATVVNIVGSAVVQEGVNAVSEGRSMSWENIGSELKLNVAQSVVVSSMEKKVPKSTKDIKYEARAAGYKGRNQYLGYLNKVRSKRVSAIRAVDSLIGLTRTIIGRFRARR